MADSSLNQALRDTLLRLHGADVLTDAQLLERFASQREEAAFAVLVRRHGPMVLRVCQRALADSHLAEDAFQSTFIILTRHAAALARPHFVNGSVAGWLHRVAWRVACQARKNALRRQCQEKALDVGLVVTPAPDAAAEDWRDARPILDEELNRLPDKYRLPLVLCYLQGKTNEEAAQQLHWPSGTAKSRLARGRALLRERLARRGVALSLIFLEAGLTREAAAAPVPAALANATIRGMTLLAAGHAATGMLSTAACSLAETVSGGMATRWKPSAVVLLLACLVGAAGWVLFRTTATSSTSGQAPRFTIQASGLVQAIRFAPDGKLMATVNQDGTVRVYDVATGQERFARRCRGPVISTTPDGTWLLSGMDNLQRDVEQWDLATGQKRAVRFVWTDPGFHIMQWNAVSADGRWMIGGNFHKITVWDAWTGAEQLTLRTQRLHDRFHAVAASPDGKTLVATESPGSPPTHRLRRWELPGGQEQAVQLPRRAHWRIHQFSPDGKWLALMTPDENPLRLYELNTGTEQVLRCRQAMVSLSAFPDSKIGPPTPPRYSAITMVSYSAFSPDSKWLATVSGPEGPDGVDGGGDQTVVRLWETASGTERTRLGAGAELIPWQTVLGMSRRSPELTFSPDGKLLASGDADGGVRVWEVPSGRLCFVLPRHDGQVPTVAFSPDGKMLAVADSKETVKLWDCPSDKSSNAP